MRVWLATLQVCWIASVAGSVAAQGAPIVTPAERPEPTASPASTPAASTPVASTPAASDAPPGYDATIDRALREFEGGNYAEARAAFLEAQRLYPNARALRGLAKAEFELRNYVACADNLEAALSARVRPLTGELRTDAQELLEVARNYVARYRLAIRPPDAELRIDGELVTLAADGSLRLNAGDHALDVRAPRHRPLRRELKVVGGVEQRLDLALAPDDRPAATIREDSSHGWLWAAGGLVVGALAAGLLAVGLSAGDDGTASASGSDLPGGEVVSAAPRGL